MLQSAERENQAGKQEREAGLLKGPAPHGRTPASLLRLGANASGSAGCKVERVPADDRVISVQ